MFWWMLLAVSAGACIGLVISGLCFSAKIVSLEKRAKGEEK